MSHYKAYLEILGNLETLKKEEKDLIELKKQWEEKIIKTFQEQGIEEDFNKELGYSFSLSKRTTSKVDEEFLKTNYKEVYERFLKFNNTNFKKDPDPEIKALRKNREGDIFIKETKIVGIKTKKVEIAKVEKIDLDVSL